MFDEFLDPSGSLEEDRHPLAAKLDTLQGKKLGIIDNGKTNGDNFFKLVANELIEMYGVDPDFVMLRKPNLSNPAPRELYDQLASEADFALTGIGD
jgi:hypothetical protein